MGKANLSGGAGGSAWQISPGAKPLKAGLGGSAGKIAGQLKNLRGV